MTRDRLLPAILGTWLLTVAVLCLVAARDIAALRFPDPDDAMRLMEVRDWLAGQSWWDVGQHRLNGGIFPMHWSRLVDLPLAFVMILGDAIGSTGLADRLAMTVVPSVTMLAVMIGVAHLTRRLADHEEATLALILTPLSIPLLYQLRPMRIDHHGWQIALAIAAVAALVGPASSKRGALAGMALAVLVTVSLEGLPITATIVAVFALSWVFDPQRKHALRALLGTLVVVAVALHLATRGPNALAASCDAISPAWLGALAVGAIGMTIATLLAPRTNAGRLVALVPGAVASLATLLVVAPDCARGPFASLDPLVRTLWYEQVSEGLPLWQQPLVWAVATVALPITGLIGTIIALRASSAERHYGWSFLLAVLVPATIMSCLVNRSGATANALALPGAAYLLLRMITRARRITFLPMRTLATSGAFLVASPGIVAVAILPRAGSLASPGSSGTGATERPPCEHFDDVRALAQLPAGTVFLPLDVSPDLVATTHHHAIAGGYHRNSAAMHRVLAAFTGTPDAAKRIVRASGADYVAGCPSLNETRLYDAVSPNGFWRQLEKGTRFDWLEPVPIAGSPVLAWRVRPVG